MKEEYDKLAKEFDLPSFEEMDQEFEISNIEGEFLLKEIRRKIVEKMENYLKMLEPVLQPEASLCDLHECKVFDAEKNKIYNLYKQMMYYNRYSIETSVNETPEKTVEFIKNFLKEWDDMKKTLANVASKLKESWLKDTDIKEELGYMG